MNVREHEMAARLQASQYPYWRVDLDRPERTVVSQSGSSIVPEVLEEFAQSLAGAIKTRASEPGADRAFYVEVCKLRFRVQMMGLGIKVAAARLIQSKNPSLSELGLTTEVMGLLSADDLAAGGGFVLFSGEIGSGKTTTAMVTIRTQLERYGGFCLSIEDPIEFPSMGGLHGDRGGYMEQIQARDMDYQTPLLESLRCFPPGERGILFIGEIRDPETAAEALRFSIAGHLVMSTIHASDPVAALQRLLSLASKDGELQARSLLATSLKLVVHQTLNKGVLTVKTLEGSLRPTNNVCARIQAGGDLGILRDTVKGAPFPAPARGG